MARSAIATVCGLDVDFDFLLGAIRHHAEVATYHVVLDVTPAPKRRRFKNLPWNTVWVYDDSYGSGDWKTFACRTARLRSLKIAQALDVDAIMHVDADEFVSKDVHRLFDIAASGACVESLIVNWGADGMPYCNLNGWVRRIWPGSARIIIPQNAGWPKSPHYDGNPERHPIPTWAPGSKVVKDGTIAHHHLHWAFPQKGLHSFGEFPTVEFPRDGIGFWPEPLLRWRAGGPPPSQEFLA